MIGQCFDVQYTLPAPVTISACHVDHVVLYSTTETAKIIYFNLYTGTCSTLIQLPISNFIMYNVQILRRVRQSIKTLREALYLVYAVNKIS